MLDLVLSEFPKTARTEEGSTIMGDQSIFFANIAATAYGAFSMLPFGSSPLISARRSYRFQIQFLWVDIPILFLKST